MVKETIIILSTHKQMNMKIKRYSILAFLLSVSSSTLFAQNLTSHPSNLFAADDAKLVSSDFSFTEGCSVDKKGNVFFTDQPNDKIWKYDTDGKLSIFLDKTGRANGTYFDKKGNLITCADEKGQLWSVSPSGKVKVLINNFNGKQFNGPNDIWIHPNGDLYFTDPYYQRDYWQRTAPDLSENDVYYLPKGSKKIKVAASGLVKPNGIVGTPDGKYLYVSDINAGKTYKYAIEKNGELTEKQLIINKGSDGMTLDEKGNIYLTLGQGVFIYNPGGELIAELKIKDGPSNVCFAGKDKNILFITARKTIYTLPMKVKGVE